MGCVNFLVDVLLLVAPGDEIKTGRLVRKSKVSTQSWPPILLGYSCGVLEKLGYTCKLYDPTVLGKSHSETITLIDEWNPSSIALYWSYDTRKDDLAFAESLAVNYRVFLVGPWSAHYPEALKDCPSVEAMTFGRFEYTLPKLIEGQKTEGVTYQNGVHIPQREPYNTAELDWMPWVSKVYNEHLDITQYHQTSFKHPFIDVFSGSGACPHRCSFCAWVNGMYQLHPKRWQKRSLRSVLDELWYIKHEMPEVKQVFFQDSDLVSSWARELSQAIIDEEMNLCWGSYSRADKDFETLSLMQTSGCRTIHVGYEVPIQSVLDEIQKDITVEQMEQFIKDVNKLNLWSSASFMILPWLTETQIRVMIKWIKDNGATRINVAQLQAYPSCPITETIEKYREAGHHLMDFDEMKKWEQYCFKEFYLYNPKFWWNVLTNPGELKQVISDGFGMLKFLGEK